MKSDSLLRLVVNSDVRKNLMFQLVDGPRSSSELKDILGISSSNLLPRLNELESENLIVKDDGKFNLTFTGMVLLKNIGFLDNLAGLIVKHDHFFNEHDMSPIPEYLLYRFGELGNCILVENSMENISATYTEVIDKISKSKKVSIISPIFDMSYPKLVLSIAERKVQVSIIVTRNIFGILEKEYADAIKAYLKHDNARLYVIDDARLAFAVTDTFSSISLYKKESFDASTNLMSFEKSAIELGEELFKYYRQKSREIKS